MVAVLLLAAGDFSTTSRGLNVDASASRPLMVALDRDPAVRLIAGWPGGPVDNVPYLARKPALLTFETHGAFHGDVILEKRRRMYAFLDAYYDTSENGMRRLRDQFAVTHLIVDAGHYRDRPPSYFAPFKARITALQGPKRPPATLRAMHAVMFRQGDLFVIDLNRLGP